MEARTFACFLLVICFFLLSEVPLSSGKKCKFEQKYVCGIEDCNCRYVSSDTYTNSFSNYLYNRFYGLLSRENHDEKPVCDKCDVYCSKEKHINCHQGSCDKKNGCICRDCWSGETCSEFQNKNVPEFIDTVYNAEIKKDGEIGAEILQLSAIDPDLEMCIDKDNCPCGKIKYSITTGNTNGLFYIDPDRGIIRLNKKLSDADYFQPILLQVLAENAGAENLQEGQSLKSLAAVTISVTQERKNVVRKRRSLTHHREKRSVTSYDALTTTFTPQTNVSFFCGGCPISFRLSVAQNTSSSPKALARISVILSSTHLYINKATLVVNITDSSVVNNLSPVITEIDPTKWKFSIANQSLGTNDSMVILFEASVKNTAKPLSLLQFGFTLNATALGDVQYGPTYSTAIYAAYPQIAFTRKTSAEYVRVETTLDYQVYMTLPYFNFSLLLEITTTINKFRFLSIESVTTGAVSSSVLLQNGNPSPLKYTGATDNVTSRVVLDFGNVVILNKNQSLNTIRLEFSVKVNDHYLLENSSSHWIGIGMRSGNQMLWVGQEQITIFKEEPFLIAEIKTLNNTAPTRYYMDDVLYFTWTVYHANASYASAKTVFISILPSKSFAVVSANYTIDVAATSLSLGDANGKKYQLNAVDLPKSSNVSGTVKLQVSDRNVAPLADLSIVIKLDYQTPDNVDRPVRTYRPSPGYFAGIPTFNLSSNATDRKIKIGKPVEISLRILIKKITLTANIEVILPVQNKSAVMRYVPNSFTKSVIGSNIGGSQLSNPELIFSSTASNSTYIDRAKFNLGEITNNDISANLIAVDEVNVVEIKFQVVLEDHEYIINNTAYWMGVGVNGGANMIWISQLALTTDVQLNRQAKVTIKPNTNGTGILEQGDVVQYNFTISHAEISDSHARDVEVLWMMPAYTTFLRLVINSHNMTLEKSGNNLRFKLSKLEFLEAPSISFLIELDPAKTLKPGKNYAVTPIGLKYKNVKKSEAFFYHPLIPMSVVFSVPTPPVPSTSAVKEFYNRGYLVDNSSSAIYICKVSKKRNKPSCFWTNTKGAVWKAVDILVVNIIGIDHANKMVYGIGNNRMAYMKYVPSRGRWFSISSEHWQLAQPNLSDKTIVTIDDQHVNEGNPELIKQHSVGNKEKWGANKIGVYYYMTQGGWNKKAVWDCCLFNE